jgi:spermidine synthase
MAVRSTITLLHALLLFLASASVLAYEILLMRLLSIGLWYHFAYMVISLALLGFGTAGSLLFLTFENIKRYMNQWLIVLAGATAVAFPLAFSLSQKVGLDPLQLVWQKSEWPKMLLTYLVMGIPFFLAGGIVGMILTGAGERVYFMYAADLLGAGAGALAIIPALYLGPPWALLPILGCLLLLGGIICSFCLPHAWKGVLGMLITGILLGIAYVVLPPVPRIHHTKPLPMTLAFPDAKVEAESFGPLGMIQVVGSSLIREAPGLSLNFGLQESGPIPSLPVQKLIFLDADTLGPITRFRGNLDDLKYLDFTSMALPYHMRHPAKVLIVGAGGGSDVLLGLREGASRIVALEENQQVADLLLGPFADFSGHLYTRPQVRLEVREARQYLHSTREQYDLIQLPFPGAFSSSAGGLQSATESYLYTTEAFELYLSKLSKTGLLAVACWLKLPPRDSLRVFSTALRALRKEGVSRKPEEHLFFIRSWKSATILVSKNPFTPEEVRRAIRFCDERSFDLVYFAGMKAELANRYDIEDQPYHYLAARALISGEADSFLRRYVFDVGPTSDDRPYFSHFFRWNKAVELFQLLRRAWLPFIDMGYIFIIATLVQAFLASGILIFAPLLFVRWVKGGESLPGVGKIFGILLYFGSIGLAFMFLELALLPKFTLLLSHPIYAAAVVLSSLLCFAGLGSMSVKRFIGRGTHFLWIGVAGICTWVILDVLIGDQLFMRAISWPLEARVGLAISMIAVLAFFLGWPFPSGLRMTAKALPGLVPWAWGINGCASVNGAVLAKCLSVGTGFRVVMFAACALYLIAAVIFQLLFRHGNRVGR